jgi:hypothetical protein
MLVIDSCRRINLHDLFIHSSLPYAIQFSLINLVIPLSDVSWTAVLNPRWPEYLEKKEEVLLCLYNAAGTILFNLNQEQPLYRPRLALLASDPEHNKYPLTPGCHVGHNY